MPPLPEADGRRTGAAARPARRVSVLRENILRRYRDGDEECPGCFGSGPGGAAEASYGRCQNRWRKYPVFRHGGAAGRDRLGFDSGLAGALWAVFLDLQVPLTFLNTTGQKGKTSV